MNWILIDKSHTPQPASGTYKEWKCILRDEGRRQCVYCAIRESRFGGFRNFHVEHYKPKKKFFELINDITNLFYICGICNSFKGSDWPADPLADWSNAAYPDPSVVNYADFLSVDDLFLVCSDSNAGQYVIERLYLNRLQLVNARALDSVFHRILYLQEQISARLAQASPEIKERLAEVLLSAIALLGRLNDVCPYEPEDVKR